MDFGLATWPWRPAMTEVLFAYGAAQSIAFMESVYSFKRLNLPPFLCGQLPQSYPPEMSP